MSGSEAGMPSGGLRVDIARGEARVREEFVCRVAGLPVEAVTSLATGGICEQLESLGKLEDSIRRTAEGISEKLHARVADTAQKGIRASLIKLRRDCYNCRPWSRSKLESSEIPPELWGTVAELSELLETRSARVADLRISYDSALRLTRERFREALRTPSFQNGLLLSSPSLFERYASYVTSGGKGARNEKIERGLLRYFTRTAMKATPFGTLCSVIAGRFGNTIEGEEPKEAFRFSGSPRVKRSHVRLNKRLYGILLEHLKGRPAVARCFAVECNSTIRQDGDRLVFLTERDSLEVFQRVSISPSLLIIMDAFAGRGAVTRAQVAGALHQAPQIECSREEAQEYIDRLVEIGFFQIHTGIREQDPEWDVKLRRFLRELEDDHAGVVANLLDSLRALANAYATSERDQRVGLLKEMQSLLRDTWRAFDIGNRSARELPLYEDATSDASLCIAVRQAHVDVLCDLARVIDITSAIAWPRVEQATMRRFYEDYYGVDVDAVDLLTFYEDYYREHFKTHLQREGERRKVGDGPVAGDAYNLANPLGVEYIGQLHQARQAIADLIRRRWAANPSSEEIAIPIEDLHVALAGVPDIPPPPRSAACFMQILPGDERTPPRIVLPKGGWTDGYGKYYSRFLYMLPSELRRSTFVQNQSLSTARWAEICGDAHFNANLHPPLFEWEISYPTSEGGVAREQIVSTQIEVTRDANDPHALSLRDRSSGVRVMPVDLGFLNRQRRPPLYQLLARFAPAVPFAVPIPEGPSRRTEVPTNGGDLPVAAPVDSAGGWSEVPEAEAEQAKPSSGNRGDGQRDGAQFDSTPRSVYRPRIVLGRGIVVARRQWKVAGAALPRAVRGEDAIEFLSRLHRWRAEMGIPDQVYIRVRRADGSPLSSASKRRPTEGDHVDGNGEEAVGQGVRPASGRQDVEGRRARRGRLRNYGKPQFIHFGSPLLVKLFCDIGANHRSVYVIIEECLPRIEELPKHEGKAFVTEVIAHIDFRGEHDRSYAPPPRGARGER